MSKLTALRTTINALYEINETRNDGLNYQYDGVVRGAAARRKLHGTDCECCRDVRIFLANILHF